MSNNFFEFTGKKINTYTTILLNFFIFIPYFFSIPELTRTLFYPWKKLESKSTSVGFNLHDWFNTLSFNILSRLIGFFLRLSIILGYFFVQIFYIVTLPFITLIFFITIPLAYLLSTYKKTDQEQYNHLKQQFLKDRILDNKNITIGEKWFDFYYSHIFKKTPFWQLNNLFSIPPLARDWSRGFTPALDKYALDLTLSQPHYKHLVARAMEIKEIEHILAKSKEANVILVGEEGVGKHTIVEALAKKIYEGKINPLLSYKRIMKMDLEAIVSQSADISQKEQLLKIIFREAEAAGNIIILIDDFHKYVSSESSHVDLTTILSDFAASSNLQFLAITNPFFFQKYIYPNEKLGKLFEKVEISEISQKEALDVLLTKVFEFEERYKLTVPYETLAEIIDKSNFYITNIPFPEKAIELLDACFIYWQEKLRGVERRIIPPQVVGEVLTEKTKIPVNITKSLKQKLINLEKYLKDRIVYQSEPVEALASTLRKSFIVSSHRKKPLANFLFLGPTGVGKTETAKAVATTFFGDEKYLIRFDMSVFNQSTSVINLIGDLEVGHPGLLTVAIREKPYGVLLLDEIEKSHKDVLNIFLTILDEGYFTDSAGKRVDCKNLIIIATSNAGSDFIYEFLKVGIKDDINKSLIDHLIEAKIFSPEFLNRFDGVIVYKPLTQEAVKEIASKMLSKINERIYDQYHIKVDITPHFIDELSQKGYDKRFGARNLERVIRDTVEDKISKLVLSDTIKEGQTITF